jgi:hypothetical protein
VKDWWLSGGGPIPVERLRRYLAELPDDYVVTCYNFGLHAQSADEPWARYEGKEPTPPEERCECPCHAGKQTDHPVTSKEPICPHCGKRAAI